MIRPLILSIAITLACGQAWAQMTFCQGDVCTEEVNGVKRTMSPAEVGKLKRQNSRTALGNVECRHASSPETCETLMRDLFAQFPY